MWCKQHAPSNKLKRSAESTAKWKRERDIRNRPFVELDALRAENAQLRVAVVEWSESYHDLCTKDVCGKLLKDISDRHEASKARLQEIARGGK